MSGGLGLKPLKGGDDHFNHLREMCERLNDISPVKAIVENYQKGSYRLAFELEWLGKFENCWLMVCANSNLRINHFVSSAVLTGDGNEGHINDRDKQLVFIPDVQLVKGPNGPIPSFVWFQRVKRSDDLWAAPRYFVFSEGFPVGLKISADREVDMRKRAPTAINQGACGMIESRSKIVNAISDDEWNIIWKGPSLAYLKRILGFISVRLDSEMIWASAPKFSEKYFKIRNVALGPLNL